MKKISIVALVLAVLLIATMAVGCAAPATKTGLGHYTSIAKSKDVSEKDGAPVDGVAQVDTVMAAVTVDAKGKLLSVYIDTAQTKVGFDATGKVTADKAAEVKTKKELGDAYGMKKASKIGKEWYEQIAVIEKWMTGKTLDQVKAMKVTALEEGGNVSAEPDVVGSASIKVDDYIVAVEEAVKNAK